jgi:hypothetical protein
MVLTETGLAKVFQRIKSFVASQLNSKASAIHTHTSSDITDLPTFKTVNNQSLLGSGNVTFTPPTFTYDSSTETLTVSNTTATVITYDANTETLEVQVNG